MATLVIEGVTQEVADILTRAAKERGQTLEAYVLDMLKAEARRIESRSE